MVGDAQGRVDPRCPAREGGRQSSLAMIVEVDSGGERPEVAGRNGTPGELPREARSGG